MEGNVWWRSLGKLSLLLTPYSGPAGVPIWTLCFGAYLLRKLWVANRTLGSFWVFRASGGHFGSLSSIMTGLQYSFLISMFSEQVYLHFGGFFFYIIWPYFTWDTLNLSYSGLHSLWHSHYTSAVTLIFFFHHCDYQISGLRLAQICNGCTTHLLCTIGPRLPFVCFHVFKCFYLWWSFLYWLIHFKVFFINFLVGTPLYKGIRWWPLTLSGGFRELGVKWLAAPSP